MTKFAVCCLIAAVLVKLALCNEPQVRVKRVIGGNYIRDGQWPWLVSLKAKIPTRTFLGIPLAHSIIYCGGSLISDRWVLTAAHCFDANGYKGKTPKYWHIRMGDADLSASVFERIRGVFGKIFKKKDWRNWSIHAEKIVIHPSYSPGQRSKWANDIALIKLEESVPVSAEEIPEIQAVALPGKNLPNFPRPGGECIMKGWGCTRNGGRVSETAKQVLLPAVSDTECRRTWGISTMTRVCAGHNLASMGICKGDSGGPLVCKYNDRWVQAGIASFTSANAPGAIPGVFTRVTHYVDWIHQTIRRG